MSSKRYTDEYKAEAVNQVLGRGHAVTDVAKRLGINRYSLYEWVNRAKAAGINAAVEPRVAEPSDLKEVRRLRAELKRVTEERDILKKAAAYFAKG